MNARATLGFGSWLEGQTGCGLERFKQVLKLNIFYAKHTKKSKEKATVDALSVFRSVKIINFPTQLRQYFLVHRAVVLNFCSFRTLLQLIMTTNHPKKMLNFGLK